MGVKLTELKKQEILEGLVEDVELILDEGVRGREINIYCGGDNKFDPFSHPSIDFNSLFGEDSRIYLLSKQQSQNFERGYLIEMPSVKPINSYVVKKIGATKKNAPLEPSSPEKTKSYIGVPPEMYERLTNFGIGVVDVVSMRNLRELFNFYTE